MAEIQKTQQEIAEEWLAIAIGNWQEEIRNYGIGNTQELYGSFHGKVIANAATLHAVELAYAWYGQMVDMGVGRGMKKSGPTGSADSRRLLGASGGRKPKPFFTAGKSGLAYQQKRLAVLLSQAIANQTVQKITGSLSTNHVINIT